MRHFYVPYIGTEPAAVSLKGHNFIILSRDPAPLLDGLSLIGADSLRELSCYSDDEEDQSLDELAREINGAIVIAPEHIQVSELLVNLELELPWLH